VWKICADNGWWSVFGKKKTRKRGKVSTPAHDDLARRDFTAPGPNQLWLTDLTEHRTSEGKLYLCAIKDVWSNRIVGYSISARMEYQIAVDALESAVARRGGDVTGCRLHSERGSQFRSRKLQEALWRHQMIGSMGQVGSAGDNAAMEMLLSVSSGHGGGFEKPEEVAGVVPLQAAHRLAFGLAFGCSAGEVVLGRLVVLGPRQDHGVKRSVQLAVASA
jgi:transposase InsO family protein